MRRASTVVVFLALGLGVLHALAYVSGAVAPDRTTRQYQDYARQVGHLLADADDITALSIGSSHSMAIDFTVLGEVGMHLWRGGGDLFEAVYVARVLAPRLPALETVYVSASYTAFSMDNATNAVNATVRRQMYASIPSHEWISGDVGNFVRGKVRRVAPVEAIVRADHWSGVIKRVLTQEPGAPAFPRDRFGQMVTARYQECTPPPPDELEEHARKQAALHVRLADEARSIRPRVEERAEAALSRLVVDLRERGVRVVLFTPPYSDPYTERIPDRLKRISREAAARVASLPGVSHVDVSADSRLADDPDLFMSSDHLNRCGAREFSRALREALRERKAR